jgi:hypothetical protein
MLFVIIRMKFDTITYFVVCKSAKNKTGLNRVSRYIHTGLFPLNSRLKKSEINFKAPFKTGKK